MVSWFIMWNGPEMSKSAVSLKSLDTFPVLFICTHNYTEQTVTCCSAVSSLLELLPLCVVSLVCYRWDENIFKSIHHCNNNIIELLLKENTDVFVNTCLYFQLYLQAGLWEAAWQLWLRGGDRLWFDPRWSHLSSSVTALLNFKCENWNIPLISSQTVFLFYRLMVRALCLKKYICHDILDLCT